MPWDMIYIAVGLLFLTGAVRLCGRWAVQGGRWVLLLAVILGALGIDSLLQLRLAMQVYPIAGAVRWLPAALVLGSTLYVGWTTWKLIDEKRSGTLKPEPRGS